MKFDCWANSGKVMSRASVIFMCWRSSRWSRRVVAFTVSRPSFDSPLFPFAGRYAHNIDMWLSIRVQAGFAACSHGQPLQHRN